MPFALTSFSALHLPASYLATINSLVPLFTVFSRKVLFGTNVSGLTIFAVCLGTSGVVLVMGLGPLEITEDVFLACFASIGAAICYSLSGIVTVQYFKNESLIALSFLSLVCAFIILTPINYYFVEDLPEFSFEGLQYLILLGALCTGLAYLLYFKILKFFGPTASSSITYSVPVFGTMWGVILLGETVTWQIFLGCVVILLASVAIFKGEGGK